MASSDFSEVLKRDMTKLLKELVPPMLDTAVAPILTAVAPILTELRRKKNQQSDDDEERPTNSKRKAPKRSTERKKEPEERKDEAVKRKRAAPPDADAEKCAEKQKRSRVKNAGRVDPQTAYRNAMNRYISDGRKALDDGHGWSQGELAEYLDEPGINQPKICMFETKNVIPDDVVIAKIARLYGTPAPQKPV